MKRVAMRRRVGALEEAARTIREGYDNNLAAMTVEVRLGDVLHVPEARRDERCNLLQVLMLLESLAGAVEEQLAEEEAA